MSPFIHFTCEKTMATNYVQDGKTVEYSNDTGAEIASGSPVALSAMIGVAITDIADGDDGDLVTEGVFTLPKDSEDDIAQGADVYLNASGEITSSSSETETDDDGVETETENTLAGKAWDAAVASSTDINVKLNA
jgi:predicted RecA/RadA family phage recombinase